MSAWAIIITHRGKVQKSSSADFSVNYRKFNRHTLDYAYLRVPLGKKVTSHALGEFCPLS